MKNKQTITTKERTNGMLSSLLPLNELTPKGNISTRNIRPDIKEIAVLFCRLNKVNAPNGMPLQHAADLLGLPSTVLKQWLDEDTQLKALSDKEYMERLKDRERIILDSLFNPISMAISELNHRLQNTPDIFTNNELLKLINILTDQYTKVYALRLSTDTQQATDTTFNQLKSIFGNARSRMVIDQNNSIPVPVEVIDSTADSTDSTSPNNSPNNETPT